MEVEQSSAPNTRTPTLNMAPMVRLCSERFCPNIISEPFKTVCDQCRSASSPRKNFLGSIGGKVTKVKLPSSVLSQVREDAPFFSSQPRIFNEQEHNMRSKRPHMTISHSQMAEPKVYNHFNSRGEIISSLSSPANSAENRPERSRPCYKCSSHSSPIGERCMNCHPTSTFDIKPIVTTPKIFGTDTSISVPIPNATFSASQPISQTPSSSKNIFPILLDVNKMDVDAEGDPDLDCTDFSYPDPSVIEPRIHESYTVFGSGGWTARDCLGNLPPGRPFAQPEVIARPPRRAVSHSSDNTSPSKVGSIPTKRQKLSHPVTEVASSSSSSGAKISTRPSQPTNAATEPKTDRTTINSARSLKLCSTGDCTGIVSSGSSATRCLSCVRRDWKKKRELASAKPNSTSTSLKEPHGRPTGNVKKKGVTWADGVRGHSHSCTIQNTSPSPKLKIKVKGKTTPSDLDCKFKQEVAHLQNSAESVVSAFEAAGSRTIAESVEPTSVSPECAKAEPENPPGLNLTCNAAPPTATDEVNKLEDAVTKEDHISGWDSDLSDISDSPALESEDGSPSKEKAKSLQPSTPSGLKIRIPARPAGSYTVKCTSQKCDQVLATGYRWKSCVMCRARRRDFHRKKHNIGSRHHGLLEELTEDENMGTPLAMDLHKHTGQVNLLPGARLCAVRNCTYIIPPVDEYNGKVCTFCLLRRTEREHLEKETGQRPRRSKLVSNPSFWLQQLDHDRADRRDGDGRCRRYGCGMLLSISSSRECKQCVARRHWLTNRFPLHQARPDGPVLLHRGSKKLLHWPRGPAPYPKYKCFSAALVEFKGRLAGFLRAQSIFFLFHQPRSANALFAFDGEYSVVALDFDIDKRREEVDANVLKLKKEIEYVGRIKFSPKRLVSILEGGGIAVRFSSMYPVPIMRPKIKNGQTTISSSAKVMQCELEIAVIPDHSHHFIPGQRTIIRFRLYG